ncbi:DUF2726 domain-containing protein [Sedimentibacter hydroxybenzoicus DSM 7310]|uniref:DUF2726 domain-containing protein n=1 Tax=Sedimentibacter hydroxybenzoicus DSM 7310 TaxID=1123245 RepID=A0A974BL15_SEDHY|nr:AAA domain-containing protein [Sedimentibacter hydroxybenzoicus]NYB75300.1 DUF2726 domain-containing protein [Sedimentibacter hydroxybenzoicus DSM 7310]
MDIVYLKDKELKLKAFNQYLKDEEKLKLFMRVFPICATTCISAHKLGEPKKYFDMVIIDEASQCNTAISLVPIIRGENLMLVGDPQQLNPVVLLSERDNAILKKKYSAANEYDYISNSIYKTFLACDAVSDEILLSYHYRCHKKIIEFNNKKYYNGKLNIKSSINNEKPLVFIDVEDNNTDIKNTSPTEANKIVKFVEENRDKKIGIITPFVNQKKYIETLLQEKGINDVTCGTVHAFQGDEKEYGKREIPILAIELDGKEHMEDDVVRKRDEKKNAICKKHGFELIRIENSYARRYNYIKDILINYFEGSH